MHLLKCLLLQPHIQERIMNIESESQGDTFRYGLLIADFLTKDAYPNLLRHCGLPTDGNIFQFTIDCMQDMHADIVSITLWIETEMLMRNWPKVQESFKHLQTFFLERRETLPDMAVWFETLISGQPHEIWGIIERYSDVNIEL